jgi:hypothetical protein
MGVRVTVWTGKSTDTDHFDNARHARHHVLKVAKDLGARREGNGNEGVLVTGTGSARKTVACYEIV